MENAAISRSKYKRIKKVEKVDMELVNDIMNGINSIIHGKAEEV